MAFCSMGDCLGLYGLEAQVLWAAIWEALNFNLVLYPSVKHPQFGYQLQLGL